MENAAKALVIAGGVLIALVTIGVLVDSFSATSQFQMSQLSQQEQEQLIAFNEQYTKYANQYVYGSDVLTLKNKYDNDGQVEVKLEGDSIWPTAGENKYEYNDESDNYSNETKYYKCTDIGYDEKSGRVNSITFKQIKLSASPY